MSMDIDEMKFSIENDRDILKDVLTEGKKYLTHKEKDLIEEVLRIEYSDKCKDELTLKSFLELGQEVVRRIVPVYLNRQLEELL